MSIKKLDRIPFFFFLIARVFKKRMSFLQKTKQNKQNNKKPKRQLVWSRKQDEGNMAKMSEEDNHCSSMYKGEEKEEILLTAKVREEAFQQGDETTEDTI